MNFYEGKGHAPSQQAIFEHFGHRYQLKAEQRQETTTHMLLVSDQRKLHDILRTPTMRSSLYEFCTWTCVVLTATIASLVCWTVAAAFLYGLPSPGILLGIFPASFNISLHMDGLNIPAAATGQANLSAPRPEERGTKMTPHVLRPILNGYNPGFLNWLLPSFPQTLRFLYSPLAWSPDLNLWLPNSKLPLSVKYPIAALLSTRLY